MGKNAGGLGGCDRGSMELDLMMGFWLTAHWGSWLRSWAETRGAANAAMKASLEYSILRVVWFVRKDLLTSGRFEFCSD